MPYVILILALESKTMGQHLPITDLDIQAFIDNELDEEEEKRIKLFIESNACAKMRYNELKEQKALIQKWARNEFFH